jgi:hypothetical protein
MPVQPEPILDIVRGLSTVASFAIVVNQLKSLYDDFFTASCERCRGTGCLTCPHCHGSKTVRKRPGFIRARDLSVVDNPGDSYSCFYCGPTTAFDFNPMAPDDEGQAMKIQENLKAAYSNAATRPFVFGALAGTVPCTACGGNPKVHRLTPDFGKVFGLNGTWDFDISRRIGGQRMADRAERPVFLEYPASAPIPVEIPTPRPDPKKASEGAEGDAGDKGFIVSKKEAYNLDDYVLNFVSDDETR